MRKFVYVCLMLPSLSLQSSVREGKSSKKKLELKSASLMSPQKTGKITPLRKGSCYIFDEGDHALTLKNVKYSLGSKNDFFVDLHLNKKNQVAFKNLAKRFGGKRKLVLSINGKVVSAKNSEASRLLIS